MNLTTDIIIYYVKLFVVNIYVYYCLRKISNVVECKFKNKIFLILINFVLVSICTYIEFYVGLFLSLIVLCFLYGMVLSRLSNTKLGYSIVITIIAYAISVISLGISIIFEYVPYILFNINNNFLNLVIILLLQFFFIYCFFNIKRFKNGFIFLYEKLNNEFADVVIINISIAILFAYCLLGTIFEGIEVIRKNLLITFIVLGSTMLIMIQKTLTMYYKQKLQKETLKSYEKELEEKEKEIEQLKNEKFNVSKISHEFYNRQKALELMVQENINMKSIGQKDVSKKVLNIVKSLTNEYTEEFDKIKSLPKLETTQIPEIDSMFKYMQSECKKNDIEFKLKIIGNIYPLINNIIPRNKLETLIGDHLRDAINAINSSDTDKKEILTILGIKDEKYELSIYDTGVDFKIETLLKLGEEAVTTNKKKGGSGIGFLTTFETMEQTKASLIISEQNPKTERYYTKSVTIRFDGKKEYKICSYRAEEIKALEEGNRIIVEKTS